MYKKYVTILFIPLLLVGCAEITANNSFDVTVKSLSLTKSMAEEIAKTTIEMHDKGLISDEDYNKVKELYIKASKHTEMVIYSVQTAIELGYLPHEYPDYKTNIEAYTKVADELLNLAIKLGIIKL